MPSIESRGGGMSAAIPNLRPVLIIHSLLSQLQINLTRGRRIKTFAMVDLHPGDVEIA